MTRQSTSLTMVLLLACAGASADDVCVTPTDGDGDWSTSGLALLPVTAESNGRTEECDYVPADPMWGAPAPDKVFLVSPPPSAKRVAAHVGVAVHRAGNAISGLAVGTNETLFEIDTAAGPVRLAVRRQSDGNYIDIIDAAASRSTFALGSANTDPYGVEVPAAEFVVTYHWSPSSRYGVWLLNDQPVATFWTASGQSPTLRFGRVQGRNPANQNNFKFELLKQYPDDTSPGSGR
jgi:hypothetical protein